MEMLDTDEAARFLDNQRILLAGARTVAAQHVNQKIDDPEYNEKVTSFLAALHKLYKEAMVSLIAIKRWQIEEMHLLLNFPGNLAKLITVQQTLEKEFDETRAFFDKLDPAPGKTKEEVGSANIESPSIVTSD